jgi:DNA-directed RNA polymerase subunit M/transcription elongation factor TFIIS
MEELKMNRLRESVLYLLSITIKYYLINYPIKGIKSPNKYAKKMEKEMFKILNEKDYIYYSTKIYNKLIIQYDKFPEEILLKKYLNGEYTIKEILEYVSDIIDPREIIKRMFIKTLYENNKVFRENKELTLDIATTIEKSCYNNIIDISKKSENPPCRLWSSAEFYDMYSHKCGSIHNLLNPKSNTCRIYGSTLLDDIINNNINLEFIACISEKEICPLSIKEEKDEIELRSEQHIIEKESDLFDCPNCKQRRITYKEVQLRALDEAPNYKCICLNCNHRFTR